MPVSDTKAAKRLSRSQQVDYMSFLNQAVQEINNSKDYTVTLNSVAHAMVPSISDWCAVDVADEHGTLQRLATAHIDPQKVKKALELGRKYPRNPSAESGTSYVFRTGEPNMRNGITDDMLVASAINDEHLAMMRSLDFQALMIVPIKSRGKVLGTLTFVWSKPGKSYSLADLAFAEILAAFAGNAIDNSQLHLATKATKR
jgi:GAF domain-containing protein